MEAETERGRGQGQDASSQAPEAHFVQSGPLNSPSNMALSLIRSQSSWASHFPKIYLLDNALGTKLSTHEPLVDTTSSMLWIVCESCPILPISLDYSLPLPFGLLPVFYNLGLLHASLPFHLYTSKTGRSEFPAPLIFSLLPQAPILPCDTEALKVFIAIPALGMLLLLGWWVLCVCMAKLQHPITQSDGNLGVAMRELCRLVCSSSNQMTIWKRDRLS